MVGFDDTLERFCADIFHNAYPSKAAPEAVRFQDRTPIHNERSSLRFILGRIVKASETRHPLPWLPIQTNQQPHTVKIAKIHVVSSTLRELDRQICASWPNELTPHTASKLIDAHGQLIADTLETLGEGTIQTAAHATFHDFSHSPAHREAARRWFVEHKHEAKKARFVFDRFDGLARLKRLKEALSGNEPAPTQATAKAPVPSADANLTLSQAGIEFIFVQPDIDGDYPPKIVEQIQRQCQTRCYFFLAFPPKCGGTFIRDVVGRVSGAALARPGHALGGRDTTPYLPMFALHKLSPTGPKAFMTHAHMIGHHSNIQLLNLFGIKPVVMKRSIPDMLCSYAEMVETEGKYPDGSYNWSILCGVHTDPSFLHFDVDARLDFLVYHQAPWYIQFYASWLRADRNKLLPVHWTTYDEFRIDPIRTITGVLDFYGLSDRATAVREAVAHAQTNRSSLRFNKGVSGRGMALLKPHHIQHLHRLARGYPDIDFVAEGLLPSVPSQDTP